MIGRAIHEHDANASMSGVEWPTWDELGDEGRAAYRQVVDDILDALRESRTVRTQEEAMALPAGSIIIDAENDTMKHYGGDHWCEPGNSSRWNARDFEYPVRVLYRPDEDGGDP